MCGIFACVCKDGHQDTVDVARNIVLGLLGLQHRGQESAGLMTASIESLKHNCFHIVKGKGLVSNIFNDDNLKKCENSIMGVGHTRYSTAGMKDAINCIQPFAVYTNHGLIAVAHNGELVNSKSLRKEVLRSGVGLSSDTDSELLGMLIAQSPSIKDAEKPNWMAALHQLMVRISLAFSIVVQTNIGIFACRDPFGNRPLCIGVTKQDNKASSSLVNGFVDTPICFYFSSESSPFPSLGAEHLRELEPGEIVFIGPNSKEPKSLGIVTRPESRRNYAMCIFEYVYFARADSVMEKRTAVLPTATGQQVYNVRYRCGLSLGKEAPLDDMNPEDCVVSTVPESSGPSALGYAFVTGLPYTDVLNKNRYVGRTFIQPTEELRKKGVVKKFGPLFENYRGKRVILIDDSIVRGNTMKPIVKLLKKTGAKEVHLRIASTPIRYPCFMGINIPSQEELIAYQLNFPTDLKPGQNLEVLATDLGCDSVAYLTLDGLKRAVAQGLSDQGIPSGEIGHCTACLDGNYPIKPENTPWENDIEDLGT